MTVQISHFSARLQRDYLYPLTRLMTINIQLYLQFQVYRDVVVTMIVYHISLS